MKTRVSASKKRRFDRQAEQRNYANDRQRVERRKAKKQKKREARRSSRRADNNF